MSESEAVKAPTPHSPNRKYDVVYFDLDGTLLDGDSRVSYETARALSCLRAAGVRIGVATGRMYSAASRYIREIESNAPAILYNGAQLAQPQDGTPLWEMHLTKEVTASAVEAARAIGAHVNFYRGREFFVESLGPHGRKFIEKENIHPQPVGDLLSLLDNGPPLKLLLIGEPTRLAPCRKKLLDRLGDDVTLMFSEPHYLEILPACTDKGLALHRALRLLGISRNRAVAFGDGENDAAMLEEAGWGVAMENAGIEAKRAANHLTGPNTGDGVVEALNLGFPGLLKSKTGDGAP